MVLSKQKVASRVPVLCIWLQHVFTKPSINASLESDCRLCLIWRTLMQQIDEHRKWPSFVCVWSPWFGALYNSQLSLELIGAEAPAYLDEHTLAGAVDGHSPYGLRTAGTDRQMRQSCHAREPSPWPRDVIAASTAADGDRSVRICVRCIRDMVHKTGSSLTTTTVDRE